MNKLQICIGVLLLCCIQLRAESPTDTQSSLELTQGYRRDTIKSTLESDRNSDGISRKFKDINIYQSRLVGTATYEDLFATLCLGYGDVTHGKERIKSIHPTNFLLNGNVRSGHTLDASLEFGKHFALTDTISLSPLAGYMWEKEKLNIKGSKTLLGVRIASRDRFNVQDTFKWNAPYLGIAGSMKASENVTFYAGYKFLFALKEHNQINWKNIGKITYSSNRCKGFGNMGSMGAGINLAPNWIVKAEYALSDIHTRGGKVRGKGEKSVQYGKTHKTTSELRLCLNYLF